MNLPFPLFAGTAVLQVSGAEATLGDYEAALPAQLRLSREPGWTLHSSTVNLNQDSLPTNFAEDKLTSKKNYNLHPRPMYDLNQAQNYVHIQETSSRYSSRASTSNPRSAAIPPRTTIGP